MRGTKIVGVSDMFLDALTFLVLLPFGPPVLPFCFGLPFLFRWAPILLFGLPFFCFEIVDHNSPLYPDRI